MMSFLTLIGLVAAIIVFLNLLQAREVVTRAGKPEPPRIPLESVRTRADGQPVVRRICPVCRTGLTPDEYLICAMDPDKADGRKRQVHIYGCNHCFITDGVNLRRYETLRDVNV